MENKLTFHINNMAYTIEVDEILVDELTKYLDINKNNSTKDLLAAYIRMTQEHTILKKELELISDKIPNL